MHTALKVGVVVTTLCLTPFAGPREAEAGRMEGVGIGAGVGAIVAGPVGAILGGVIGYAVGGPDLVPPRRHACWRGDDGRRYCRRR
jgi:outer membrane lipoprotein SlyB